MILPAKNAHEPNAWRALRCQAKSEGTAPGSLAARRAVKQCIALARRTFPLAMCVENQPAGRTVVMKGCPHLQSAWSPLQNCSRQRTHSSCTGRQHLQRRAAGHSARRRPGRLKIQAKSSRNQARLPSRTPAVQAQSHKHNEWRGARDVRHGISQLLGMPLYSPHISIAVDHASAVGPAG